MTRCRHSYISTFKSGSQWRCSACHKTGAWGPTWRYFGSIGCRKCGSEPAIEFVACSEGCAATYQDTTQSPTVEPADKKQQRLDRVRALIDATSLRLDALKRTESRLKA